MNNPLVSIVAPIYNVEAYLPRCIDSVLNQKYMNFELILVDDGSPDKSPTICDEYQMKDDRIVVIHKQNGGLSDARNSGIDKAKGKYIIFLDSDDQWLNELDVIVEIIEKEGCDFLVFDSISLYENGDILKRKTGGFFKNHYSCYSSEEYYQLALENGNLQEAAYTKIMTLDFLKANSLYFKKGIIGEDTEWMFRLLRASRSIGVTDVVLYIYTESRTGAITNSIPPKRVKDQLLVIRDCLYYNENNNNYLKEYEISYCSYLWYILLGMWSSLGKKDRSGLKHSVLDLSYLSDSKFPIPQVTRASHLYRIAGFTITAFVLRCYMFVLKKGYINNKKRIN